MTRSPLAVPPDPGHGLQVGGGVPVDVVEHESAGTDQVEARAARLGAEQHHPGGRTRVEVVDDALSGFRWRAAVQSAGRQS